MKGTGKKLRTGLKLLLRYLTSLQALHPDMAWKKSLSVKSIFNLTIMLFLSGAVLIPVCSYSAAQSGSTNDLSSLPLTFPAQTPELITYFNDIARPEDIVSLPEPFLHALPDIKAGQTMVAFASWQKAEKTIPSISTKIDWVLYYPEHWENTPASEQRDLPATIQDAAEFLRARQMRLFLAPDRRYIDEKCGGETSL